MLRLLSAVLLALVTMLTSTPAYSASLFHRHKKEKQQLPDIPDALGDQFTTMVVRDETINAYVNKKEKQLLEAKTIRPDLIDSQINPALELIKKIRNTLSIDPQIPDLINDLHSRMSFILDAEEQDVI